MRCAGMFARRKAGLRGEESYSEHSLTGGGGSQRNGGDECKEVSAAYEKAQVRGTANAVPCTCQDVAAVRTRKTFFTRKIRSPAGRSRGETRAASWPAENLNLLHFNPHSPRFPTSLPPRMEGLPLWANSRRLLVDSSPVGFSDESSSLRAYRGARNVGDTPCTPLVRGKTGLMKG